MNRSIDIKTIEALRSGSHKAFEIIFITYYNKIKTFIFNYIKSENDAEELAEDIFANIWFNRQSIDTSKSFESFLHTIARNAALNFLKHKYVHDAYVHSLINSECTTPTSEENLIAKELGLLIDDVVEKMPNQRRRIYQLSRKDGLSNEEISTKLNTTKRNVESQLSLALKDIRKVISLFFISII